MKRGSGLNWLLGILLAACIARLWLLPLPSSFWVDEMVTAFVAHYGGSHPSLAVAPQVAESVYYWLPAMSERVFGFSEMAYRLPSLLLMGGAMFLIFRIAARLIHPEAGWFAVFACLTLKIVNYEAADARPYALGTCIAAAGLWFLMRWMDDGHGRDGVLFAVCAALLWRVHLIYWPFYLVFGAYSAARWRARDTPVTWRRGLLIYAAVAVALIPVALRALSILSHAQAHVIVDHLPTFREFNRSLKWGLVAGSAAGAFLLSLVLRRPQTRKAGGAAVTLAGGWWLVHPLALFGFSHLTKNSVFVDRYLSLSLPGAALAATLAVGYFLPASFWRTAAVAMGAGVLLLTGSLRESAPRHHNSDWKEASRKIRQLGWPETTPMVYPSPFIEAQTPLWKPDYPLPGFLYCHLLIYPVPGPAYLLPFKSSPEARAYAGTLAGGALSAAGRFVIYGGDVNVHLWQGWFAARPEFAGWITRRLGGFGDVDVATFENPTASAAIWRAARK